MISNRLLVFKITHYFEFNEMVDPEINGTISAATLDIREGPQKTIFS